MDKRTTAIIATVITGLLCGCPGLAILCYGAFAIPTSYVPGAQIDVFGNNDPQSLLTSGIVGLCLGILLIAIPVVVGFTTLRNRPAAAGMVVPPAPPRPVPPAPPSPPVDFTPPPAPPEAPPAEPAEPESLADAWMKPQEEAPAEEPSEPPAAEASDWQAPTVIGEQPMVAQPPETPPEAAPEAPPETPPETSPAEPPKPDEDDDAIPPAI